jgi:hypothetical protein
MVKLPLNGKQKNVRLLLFGLALYPKYITQKHCLGLQLKMLPPENSKIK